MLFESSCVKKKKTSSHISHSSLPSTSNLPPSPRRTLHEIPRSDSQLAGEIINGKLNWHFPSTLFLQLNDYEIRKGKKIGVTVSYNNHRLFVGNIPKNRDRDDLFEEFTKHARKLTIVLKSASSNRWKFDERKMMGQKKKNLSYYESGVFLPSR